MEFDYKSIVQTIVRKLGEPYASGIGAIGECTPYRAGYVDLFADVARQCRVKIIVSTGFVHQS